MRRRGRVRGRSGHVREQRARGDGRAGFTISLTKDGQPVTALEPGLYFLTVHDLAANHNFHVIGPGVDVTVTSVAFVGTVTVPLKVKDGEFVFQCDPHQTTMRGTFVGLGAKVKLKS